MAAKSSSTKRSRVEAVLAQQELSAKPLVLGEREVSDADAEIAARRGIQSLDAALGLLKTLAKFPTAVGLADLARAADLPTSKAHRYLASFMKAGLVVQQGRLGRYDLGPRAVEIGLASLGRNDFVNRAADALEELSTATGLTALLSVWGGQGATIVRWERSSSTTVTSFGLGSTLPLLSSSSGRVFLAFLPRRITAARMRIEMERWLDAGQWLPDIDPNPESIDRMVEKVRADRLAALDERSIPGLFSLSAPITNWQGEIEVAVTLVGTLYDHKGRRPDWQQEIREFAQRLSIGPPGDAVASS
ncbi:IclR family transcriptional regulator [Sphingobium sp. JS3065]|uniref:IclR family transcriptional regulator n=1 Tax=Sphingobium sp. JS3065 TaxID=2970925 RepID=UPI002264ABF8|nr:IclR family transcriptional regulator [Sphingobium sp. JS3065]UZW55354.1 IclR family transcriptional regulator [Sphingobium sp. JS3065]